MNANPRFSGRQAAVGLILLVAGLGKIASLFTLTSGYLVYHEGQSLGDTWTLLLGLAEIGVAVALQFQAGRAWGLAAGAALFFGYALGLHRFWEFEIEAQFVQQLLFMKNLLIGALLITGIEPRRTSAL